MKKQEKKQKQIHIVSFSGGKDSTAMLLRMLELNMPIHYILCADTGMEFPEMYNHISDVKIFLQKYYPKQKITIIKSDKDFLYYMFEHKKTQGKNKGKKGYMWMDWRSRWCTSKLKQEPIQNFYKTLEKDNDFEIIEYHGIAKDEEIRTKKNKNNKRKVVYPLVDWGWTESDALKYCYSKGFFWGGLYEYFSRLSCYLCPFQKIGELRILYYYFPNEWAYMKELDDKNIALYNRKFRADYSIRELEEKFKKESACKSNK